MPFQELLNKAIFEVSFLSFLLTHYKIRNRQKAQKNVTLLGIATLLLLQAVLFMRLLLLPRQKGFAKHKSLPHFRWQTRMCTTGLTSLRIIKHHSTRKTHNPSPSQSPQWGGVMRSLGKWFVLIYLFAYIGKLVFLWCRSARVWETHYGNQEPQEFG